MVFRSCLFSCFVQDFLLHMQNDVPFKLLIKFSQVLVQYLESFIYFIIITFFGFVYAFSDFLLTLIQNLSIIREAFFGLTERMFTLWYKN